MAVGEVLVEDLSVLAGTLPPSLVCLRKFGHATALFGLPEADSQLRLPKLIALWCLDFDDAVAPPGLAEGAIAPRGATLSTRIKKQ